MKLWKRKPVEYKYHKRYICEKCGNKSLVRPIDNHVLNDQLTIQSFPEICLSCGYKKVLYEEIRDWQIDDLPTLQEFDINRYNKTITILTKSCEGILYCSSAEFTKLVLKWLKHSKIDGQLINIISNIEHIYESPDITHTAIIRYDNLPNHIQIENYYIDYWFLKKKWLWV